MQLREREREEGVLLLINFVNEMQIHAALWGKKPKEVGYGKHAHTHASRRTFFFKHALN